MAKVIMIQGAGSNVGKSIIVAGLARAMVNRGIRVAPFKPQNMSNNAAVTVDGGEIGRAQALQALAARIDPTTDMNPVLLKPETDTGAQIVVQGKRVGTMKAREYARAKPQLLKPALQSFYRLCDAHDLVLIEGAGSPAETNLRAGDIANMGFAEATDIPVALIGDIDRGGVIAQIVGTKVVLSKTDANRIKAFAINKFRGDASLFNDGISTIESHTNWPSLGVIPWFKDAWKLPAEDVMDIASKHSASKHSDTFKIVVPRLSRIANFDDLDPLSGEPDVNVQIIEQGRPLPLDADLILIPGTKSTIADLGFFRAQGWDVDLAAHIRRGGAVLGICGGYQMLGKEIIDADGIEGPPCRVEGLGHLDVVTHMRPEKHLNRQNAVYLDGNFVVTGYEIHIGETSGPDCAAGWLSIAGAPHGASANGGQILGCYLHGLFTSDSFRAAFLEKLGGQSTGAYAAGVDTTLNDLAAHLEQHLDIDLLLSLAKPPRVD